ncbi:MAG: phage virion morphogenesis protein [Methylotenera sp.]|nr:phage virion morphogenesis protein [Methylotenera sp.]
MIEVKFDNKTVLQALGKLANASANPRPALLSIGEDLVKSTKNRFNESRGPDGKAWAPNSPLTLIRKRGTKPLIDNGILRDQISYAEEGNTLTIFSTLEYAATQQFGAKKGAFGRTKRNAPIPWGDIPSRPFLGISFGDEQMIEETISDYLIDVLNQVK